MIHRNKIISEILKVYLISFTLACAFILAYRDTFVSLFETWLNRPDYNHGFLVPMASIYFIYAMRSRLKTVKIAPNIIMGATVTLVAVLMLVLGVTGGMVTIQQLSVIIAFFGVVVLLLGKAMLKALLLPLGYLVLMVPLMLDIVFAPLHWPFQLFGAKIAAMLLSNIGIPVFHSAQYIELPNMPLEVANACSGIRYLVSIMAIAVPLAYLTLDTWPKRVFLVVSSVLIGILANPVRIALIGVWVYKGGSILHGPGHMLQGYFVSVVGFGFLFIATWVMSRKQTKSKCSAYGWRGEASESDENVEGKRLGHTGGVNRPQNEDCRGRTAYVSGKAWACAISIMLAAGIFVNYYRPVPVPLRNHQDLLPLELNGWKGSLMNSEAVQFVVLPAPDIEKKFTYTGPENEIINLIIGYYEYQHQDKEFIHYTLQKLYDGAKTIRVEVGSGRYIEAKQVLIKEAGRRYLVTYWYEIDGYVTSSNSVAKFIAALKGLLQWKNNGAIILLTSNLTISGSVENSALQQANLVAALYPFIEGFSAASKPYETIY